MGICVTGVMQKSAVHWATGTKSVATSASEFTKTEFAYLYLVGFCQMKETIYLVLRLLVRRVTRVGTRLLDVPVVPGRWFLSDGRNSESSLKQNYKLPVVLGALPPVRYAYWVCTEAWSSTVTTVVERHP